MGNRVALLLFDKCDTHLPMHHFMNDCRFCVVHGEVVLKGETGIKMILKKDNWISIKELEMVEWDELDAVTSTKDVRLLAFRDEDVSAKGLVFQTSFYKNIATGLLNSHPFFGKLRRHTLNTLVSDFHFETLKSGSTFCKENQYLNSLVLVVSGKLEAEDPSRSLGPCSVVYGNALSETNIPASIRAKDTLRVEGRVIVGQASLYRVGHLLKGDMRELLEDRVELCHLRKSRIL